MAHRWLAAVCAGLVVASLSAQGPPPQPSGTGLIVGQVVDALSGRGVPDVAVTLVQPGYVRPGGAMTSPRPLLSDAQGHFVFRDLPAASFQITARRSGYVESMYGALSPDGEGKIIALAEGGRVSDIKVTLWKQATIAGTVLDDAGDPIIGLQVRAYKRNLIAGRWKFGEYYSNQRYGAKTDDRGVYRLIDVEPGDYVVCVPLTTAVAPASAVAELEALFADPSARAEYTAANQSFDIGIFSPSRLPHNGTGGVGTIAVGDTLQTLIAGLAPTTPANGPWLMYQTQFYPGTTMSGSALAINVKAAQEVNGIDFSMKPVRAWRISGTVTGLTTGSVALRLVQTDSDSMFDPTEVAATLSGADGAFSFIGVPTGQYVIKVVRVPRLPDVMTQVGQTTRIEQAAGVSAEPTLWASVPVSVSGGDVTGVGVALQTGARATGRLVFDGARAKPTAAQLSGGEVTIEAATGERPLIYRSDRVRLGGETFQTAELTPGRYLIRATVPAGWTMKSVVADGRDVADTPLVVDSRGIPPIVVTFTDRTLGSLTGRVVGAPATGTTFVCVFPAEQSAWVDYGGSPRRLRRVQPNQNGQYRVADLPAGEYFAVAVADDRVADWRDPKHLEALSRIATRLTLADEEARTLDVSVQRTPASPLAMNLDVDGLEPFVADLPDEQTAQTPPRASPRVTPQPTGGGSISGVVTTGGPNPSPIRRVIVTLNSTDPKVGRTTVTDEAGRFTFASLPSARYLLAASKEGYLYGRYGATAPGRPGTPIVLADREQSSVTVTLTKGAVITGTIRDDYGEPVRDVSVSVSELQFVNGERRLNAVDFGQRTDDRGQYRVFGLPPGEYYVAINRANIGFYVSLKQTTADEYAAAERLIRGISAPAASTGPAPQSDRGYAPVFYPGTSSFAQAEAVSVAAGEEKGGIDILLRLVPLAHLAGRVLGPDGQSPAMVQARLVPPIAVPGWNFNLEAGTIFPVTDGVIRINSIPPGEYTLHVGGSTVAPPPMSASGGGFGVASAANGTLGLPMWASVPVTIDGRDIDGLTVQLQLGKTISGRVVYEGTTPPPASMVVYLNGPSMNGATLSRSGTASPAFTINGIIPAAYRVTTSYRTWMIKSAVINGRDAADLPVDINSDASDVVVTLTDKLTELSGVLQTPAGAPATNYFVIVFAKDQAYWFSGSRRIVSLRPGTDGRFVTPPASPLPPGDYLVAAVTDVRSGEWFEPAFLKTLVSSAVPVSLAEGERKKLEPLQIK